MSKSPWFTPTQDKFVITVTGGSEGDLMKKVDEHIKNGFELLKTFDNTTEAKYYQIKRFYARLGRVNKAV